MTVGERVLNLFEQTLVYLLALAVALVLFLDFLKVQVHASLQCDIENLQAQIELLQLCN